MRGTLVEIPPNIFRGLYIQPEFILGFYNAHITREEFFASSNLPVPITTTKVNYQALMINLGGQGVSSNLAVFDYFIGIGLGRDNINKDQYRSIK